MARNKSRKPTSKKAAAERFANVNEAGGTRHVKKGQEVVVLSGRERGNSGKIREIITGTERAIVEGLQMIKRHTKRSQDNPQGAIVKREGTIHLSNLMAKEEYEARRARKGVAVREEAPAAEEKAEA